MPSMRMDARALCARHCLSMPAEDIVVILIECLQRRDRQIESPKRLTSQGRNLALVPLHAFQVPVHEILH